MLFVLRITKNELDSLNYRRPSLIMGVKFQDNTANSKTANTKFNNDLKIGVPFLIFIEKMKKTYTKTNILTNIFTFLM